MLADNINPNKPEYARHKAAITAAFILHMGGEVVDASLLQWSGDQPDTDDPEIRFHGYIPDDPSDESSDS